MPRRAPSRELLGRFFGAALEKGAAADRALVLMRMWINRVSLGCRYQARDEAAVDGVLDALY